MRTSNEIIDIIKITAEKRNISLSELARRVNMSKSTISRYFNKNREFPLNYAETFATALGITTYDLLGINDSNDNHYINNYFSLPTLINLSAGTPDELIESDEIVWIPKDEFYHKRHNLIAARINGDSMNKIFPNGSTVVLEKVEMLKNGDIGAFLIDEQHDATIKRFRQVGNAFVLSPESTNSIYEDIYLDLEQHYVKILGKLVYYVLPGDVEF